MLDAHCLAEGRSNDCRACGTGGEARFWVCRISSDAIPASRPLAWATRVRGSKRHLPQSRQPRRGDRDHVRSSKISYRDILEFFFQIHDPTTLNRQGNDLGSSYRSAIFYADDEQRLTAEDTIADVNASGLWPGNVVTEVAPVTAISGKRNRSTRTIWNAFRADTHAILSDPVKLPKRQEDTAAVG